ncbi:MAG: hypothetical protein H0V09_11730 [Gemmatimonadetes bacterium]|nr:hypothetical protein [Gemmatimonadota bacterium]
MASLAPTHLNQAERSAGWREAQSQVLGFMQEHPRQWWAIDRLSQAVRLPQGFVTMLLVELWIDGRVTREWAGDQPIFQLHKA